MKKVAILIPYYKNNLTIDEKVSIEHLRKYLKRYDKFLIVPSNLKKVSANISAKIERFPSRFFLSTSTYSRLLNQSLFYERFTDYEYILIYQLDALVFKDELWEWCNKGYDYIGAPLFNSLIGKLTSKRDSGCNGGLSLRKVSSAIKVIKNAENRASRTSSSIWKRRVWFITSLISGNSRRIWLDAPPADYPFNEDGFWSFEAIKYDRSFRVAPFNVALKFAFEKFPERCFKLNKKQLPFGCHGWKKYSKQFWEQHISRKS